MDLDKQSQVTQWKNGKEKNVSFADAFQEVYAKSYQKLSSLSRHLLIGNYMDSDLGSSEKENMRNKLELREWFRIKIQELAVLREKRPLDLDGEYISYADAMLADDNMKDDEESMINECLAMYQNLALPTTASILSGMYYILRDPKIK